jgi:hypothetical protein
MLFLLGIAIFLICAIQVYSTKFLKKGVAIKGLYRWISMPSQPPEAKSNCLSRLSSARSEGHFSCGDIPLGIFLFGQSRT